MKIIIVDDSKQFREGLRFFLEAQKEIEIIAEAENGKQVIELPNIHQADIILMDIEMPEMNGIDAAKKIIQADFHKKIIAITMYTETTYLKALLEAGFKGCVFKNNVYDQAIDAINEVKNGGYYFPDDIKLED